MELAICQIVLKVAEICDELYAHFLSQKARVITLL